MQGYKRERHEFIWFSPELLRSIEVETRLESFFSSLRFEWCRDQLLDIVVPQSSDIRSWVVGKLAMVPCQACHQYHSILGNSPNRTKQSNQVSSIPVRARETNHVDQNSDDENGTSELADMTIEHDRIGSVPRLCSAGGEFDRLVEFSTKLSNMFFGRFFHILGDFRHDRRITFRPKNDQVEQTLRQTRLDSRDRQALHLEKGKCHKT